MVYVTSDLIIPRFNSGQTLAYAVNATTGILIWNFTVTASSNSMSPPAVADGIFYMNIYNGLLALDAKTEQSSGIIPLQSLRGRQTRL